MTVVSKSSKTNSKKLPKAIDLNRPHFCTWCQKAFAKEATLVSHSCEPRRRSEAQYNPDVKLGYASYLLFNEGTAPKNTTLKSKSYQEFCVSRHYTEFVRFGNWLIEQQVQEIETYVRWLLKQKADFKKWSDVLLYNSFLSELLHDETPEMGLQRSLRTVQKWTEEQDLPMQDFWIKVNPNLATRWISQGKISPWMLYNCNSAVEFFERCNPEQLYLIQTVAPVKKWKVRLLRYKQQADLIKSVLTEAGM
jgi:hypothetical protein